MATDSTGAARLLALDGGAPGAAEGDGTLLERARGGDREAFHQLFVRHAPAVRRLLGGLLRDAHAADDAAQEAFLRAWTRLAEVREPSRVRSFLLGTARMLWLEETARAARDERLLREPSREEPVATPEQDLAASRVARDFQRALAGLAPERQMALLLRLDQGLDYPAIGEAMGWPLHKVKNELHRARLQLREALHGWADGEEGR